LLPSYTSASGSFVNFPQILGTIALANAECHCPNQQVYLGCYFLRSSVTRALKRALNIFGSDTSASDGETAPREWLRKHSKETPPTKDVSKSSTSATPSF
jgi:hypothetical protein